MVMSLSFAWCTCAGSDDLREVLEFLAPVNLRWRELGICLGLKDATLDEIKANYYYDVSSCKREMLSKWLNWVDGCEASCNWKSLAKALRDVTVNHAPVADAIEQKHSIN